MAEPETRKSVLQLVHKFEEISLEETTKRSKKSFTYSVQKSNGLQHGKAISSSRCEVVNRKCSEKQGRKEVSSGLLPTVVDNLITFKDDINKNVLSSKCTNSNTKAGRIKARGDVDERFEQSRMNVMSSENNDMFVNKHCKELPEEVNLKASQTLSNSTVSLHSDSSNIDCDEDCVYQNLSYKPRQGFKKNGAKTIGMESDDDIYECMSLIRWDNKKQKQDGSTKSSEQTESDFSTDCYENQNYDDINDVMNGGVTQRSSYADISSSSSHRQLDENQSIKEINVVPLPKQRQDRKSVEFDNGHYELLHDYLTITKYERVVHDQMNIVEKNCGPDEVHYKTLLTVFPNDNKATQTEISKVKLSSNYIENEEVQKYTDTKEFIVGELIDSEEYYISQLQIAIYKYQQQLQQMIEEDETETMFNVLEEILKGTIAMLRKIMKVRFDYEAIGMVFLDNIELFDIYPIYCKNKANSIKVYKKHEDLIASIAHEIGDKLGLSSHLLLPIQRLAKYEQLLIKLRRALERSNLPMTQVDAAANLIQNISLKSNDLVELDLIRGISYHFTETGHFLMRDCFRLLSPKKCNVVLFLFHDKVIFTKEDNNKIRNYIFFKDVNMEEISLNEESRQLSTFTIIQVLRLGKYRFRLDARIPEIKTKWVRALTIRMWEQFDEAKRKNNRLYDV